MAYHDKLDGEDAAKVVEALQAEKKQLKSENLRLKKQLAAAKSDIQMLINRYPQIDCQKLCVGDCADCNTSATNTAPGFKWRGAPGTAIVERGDEWIGVEDRLPAEEGWYYATISFDAGYGNMQRYGMSLYYANNRWIDNIRQSVFDLYDVRAYDGTRLYTIDLCDRTNQVTHWRPLPPPPPVTGGGPCT